MLRTHALKSLLAIAVAAMLSGCISAAEVSYGEYRVGPGFQTERVYAQRIYGGAEEGFGRQTCQVMVQRQADLFGIVSEREVSVCEPW